MHARHCVFYTTYSPLLAHTKTPSSVKEIQLYPLPLSHQHTGQLTYWYSQQKHI